MRGRKIGKKIWGIRRKKGRKEGGDEALPTDKETQ